jgi:glucose/mannose transport system permease protein
MARRSMRLSRLNPVIGSSPMIAVGLGVYVIGIAFSILLSFTDSKLFASFDFVGLQQYERLWKTSRWLVSVQNIWVFGVLVILFQMTLGYLLAVFLDQRIRQEDTFRTIFLYPFSMSLVVTGLVWQWMLDPNLGITATVRRLGWEDFEFAPLVRQDQAIFGLVLGNVWNGVGVTMAIMLAGLRGVDEEIWKASRVDGIPAWRTYLFIVLPMIRGAVLTAFILQCTQIVRVYDLVVAMTQGGPGVASQMPAVFVIEHLQNRQNVALGMAAATMMLVPVVVLLFIKAMADYRAVRRAGAVRP